MRTNNLVLTYLLLVGVPLLALFGILRAGRLLPAPISVAGDWNLDANFGALGDSACASLLNGIPQPFFTISQSGRSLVFVFNDAPKTARPAVILGTAVNMPPGKSSPPVAANCSDARTIYLQGRVTALGRPRILTGTLGATDCPACLAIPFRAVRQEAFAGGGR